MPESAALLAPAVTTINAPVRDYTLSCAKEIGAG